MAWTDVIEYASIAEKFDRMEKRQALAIATNPHLKAEHQQRLWRIYEVEQTAGERAIAKKVHEALGEKGK